MKKVLTMIGVILGYIVIWILVWFIAQQQLGGAGGGGVLLLGFIGLPITIRLLSMKLFGTGKKKLDV